MSGPTGRDRTERRSPETGLKKHDLKDSDSSSEATTKNLDRSQREQKSEMKKSRHSKHQPEFKSIHKSSLSKLDTELLKHIEAKRRHREHLRRKERKEERELIDAKQRMEKRLEEKKKKKLREERKGHQKKNTHQNGRKLVQMKKRAKEKHADRKSETPTKKSTSSYSGTSDPSDSEPLKHKEEKFSQHTSGFIPSSPSPPPFNNSHCSPCQSTHAADIKISEDDDQSNSTEPDHVDTSEDDSVQINEDDSKPTLPDKQMVSGKHPISSKEGVLTELGVHHAPDLLPAHCSYSEELLRLDPPTSPPVLSWQGSPVSDLDDDVEDGNHADIIRVLRRPVLQPSPTHSSPLRDQVDTSTGVEYCHSDLAKLYGLPEPSKGMEIEDEDDEKQESDQKDGSPDALNSQPNKPHLHQMDTSPNSAMSSHRYTYRGGPFGRPPPGALVGLKYSSSLSLGPEIHPPGQQSPPATSPTQDIPDQVSSLLIQPDKEADKERKTEAEEQEREETEAEQEEETEEQKVDEQMEISADELSKDLACTSVEEKEPLMTPATLQAKLAESCELLLKQNSSPVSVTERKALKGSGSTSTEKEKDQDGVRQRDQVGTLGKKAKGEDQVIPENQQNDKKEQDTKPEETERGNEANVVNKSMKEDTVPGTKRHMASVKASSTITSTKTSCLMTGTTPLMDRINLLNPDALSKIPLKELMIRLIKVEIGDRKTFIASEIEQKSIPLKTVTIRNNATEIIRACK